MNTIFETLLSFYSHILMTMLRRALSIPYCSQLCIYYVNKRYFKTNFPFLRNKKNTFVPNSEVDLKTQQDSYIEPLSFVPISVIKQNLLNKNIIFADKHTCILMDCPICKHYDPSLFVNKISGAFVCTNCKKSGSWNLLEMFFSSRQTVNVPDDEMMRIGKSAWDDLCKNLILLDNNFINHSFLCDFKVPLSLYKELGVRVDPKKNEIYFPLMFGNQPVGYKSLKSDHTEETFPFKEAKGILINERQKKSALIVANLLDFIALLSEKLEYDIICMPHGQQNLSQELLPLFEQYDNIVLWFDNDNVSWGNAKMFAKKLSESRCSLIRPLENQPSPYSCLKQGYNVSTIVKNAQPVSHASIVTFANLREDILTELYNTDKVSGVKWERFPALNGILKGHRRGELTILTGPTGSGKTTFMSEYSLDLASSRVTTLWGSFEIRNQRLAKTMMTQMFSAPLEKNLNMFNEWADKFERLPIYFMTFHGQQPLNTVMEAVEHATYVHDVAHVIIDNVQFMLGISNNEAGFLDRFSRQDALIASFRNFATTFNCHVTLVIHPRKERDGEQLTANSIFGGAKAAQEADNILIIQHKMSHASLKLRKFLQVAKNRFSGDLGVMPLEFDKEALSFRTKEK